ncbi:hypothetical protein Vafri_10488 [Volvox africanus]|nr:hypothetical protein Vafri_10488 [Volvox africanus]
MSPTVKISQPPRPPPLKKPPSPLRKPPLPSPRKLPPLPSPSKLPPPFTSQPPMPTLPSKPSSPKKPPGFETLPSPLSTLLPGPASPLPSSPPPAYLPPLARCDFCVNINIYAGRTEDISSVTCSEMISTILSDIDNAMCYLHAIPTPDCIRVLDYTSSCSNGNRLVTVCTSILSADLSSDLRTTLESEVHIWLHDTMRNVWQLCFSDDVYITAWISSPTSCFNTTVISTSLNCDIFFQAPPPPPRRRRRPSRQ